LWLLCELGRSTNDTEPLMLQGLSFSHRTVLSYITATSGYDTLGQRRAPGSRKQHAVTECGGLLRTMGLPQHPDSPPVLACEVGGDLNAEQKCRLVSIPARAGTMATRSECTCSPAMAQPLRNRFFAFAQDRPGPLLDRIDARSAWTCRGWSTKSCRTSGWGSRRRRSWRG
jgi:hypothetical protein